MNELRELLKANRIRPKKSLGQNFLFDERILERIVGAANLLPGDAVLEIGCGVGNLTRLIAASNARVFAVELDERFFPILEYTLDGFQNVTLIQSDILDFQPSQWFQRPYKVVANVPYYITGRILRHLLSVEPRPCLMILTVQAEVAQRITAEPPNMSLLAASIQFYATVKEIDRIKAGAFWPRPEVDSAVIEVKLNETQSNSSFQESEAFFRVVRAGFGQKRKQLQNNLRVLDLEKSVLDIVLQKADIDGRRRAETLSIAEWKRLADEVSDQVGREGIGSAS